MHSVAFGPVLHCVGHPACPGFPVVTTIDTVLAASQCCKKGFAQQVRAGGLPLHSYSQYAHKIYGMLIGTVCKILTLKNKCALSTVLQGARCSI